MVAVAGRDRYLVRYHTAYADWDARPQGPLPRAVGSYTWQCAGYETDIRTLPFAQDWVAARLLAEDEDYGTGVLDWALPAVSQSAVYRRNSDQYILVTLRAGTPDPAAAPELVYQDFYDEDGDLLRCLWRDPVTGSELEMEPCGAWIAEAELDALISHLEAQAADLLAAV